MNHFKTFLWVAGFLLTAQTASAVDVKIFTAPNCELCIKLIPPLEQQLSQWVGDKASGVSAQIVVIAGNNGEKPNAETVAEHAKALGSKLEAVADIWKHTAYRALVGDAILLPAVAVLDDNGKVIKKFVTKFDPDAIAEFVASKAGQGVTGIDAVKKLEGHYTGEWENFGVNEKGEVVPQTKFTSQVTVGESTQANGKAFVKVTEIVTDEKTGNVFRLKRNEGFFVGEDGLAGDRFIEEVEPREKLTRLTRLGPGTWMNEAIPTPKSLEHIGLKNVTFARISTLRARIFSSDVETERVTTLMTVNWLVDGKPRTLQFTLSKGYLDRQKE